MNTDLEVGVGSEKVYKAFHKAQFLNHWNESRIQLVMQTFQENYSSGLIDEVQKKAGPFLTMP